MKINSSKFVYKKCTQENLAEICNIQEEAFACIENPDILRRNSQEILKECLEEPHYTVGAFFNGELAGFAVLYDGGHTKENIGRDIGIEEDRLDTVKNMKLVIVRPKYRGNNLQIKLTSFLENIAAENGAKIICATVSPYNIYSMRNFEALGYKLHSCKMKYGGLKRNIYYKYI